MYFLKDSQNYEQKEKNEDEFQMLMSSMDCRSEYDILQERIEKDLVAFGNFSASDIINHSVYQEEFTHLEPGLFDQ